jgi:hypothetical protein
MDIISQGCKLLSDANKLWDKTPDPVKPLAAGVSILIGLLLHKIVVAAGVVVFFGGRTVHKMGIDQQVLDEEKNGIDKDSRS